jgi:hypothetical protein
MEKEYRIKDYFNGSDSQLKYLGKMASGIYRITYGKEPNKIDVENELWTSENVYPESILEQLEKPVKNKITEVYCSPVVKKNTIEYPVKHGWNCKYKEYNEYIIKNYPGIRGVLKTKPYIKKDGVISSPYSYYFELLNNNVTYVCMMKDNSYTRTIMGILNICEVGDKVSILFRSKEDGFPEMKLVINERIAKNIKFDQKTILSKIKIIE